MAATLHKLLKKQPPLRILTTFKTPKPANPQNPLLHQPHLVESKPNHPNVVNPLWGSSNTEWVYPSYPFGYFLNPISVNVVNPLEEVEGGTEDAKKIWADSVKKKRKRKMNKHKLRKLRKRLRRKT